MRRVFALCLLARIIGFGVFACAVTTPVQAQAVPKSLEQGSSDNTQRDRSAYLRNQRIPRGDVIVRLPVP
jgi:hypothetical protein